MEWLTEYNQKLEKALNASAALGPGVRVGKIISFAVADGVAYYRVTKVNKRTARVEWVEELALDGYKYMLLNDKDSISLAKIEPMIAHDDLLRKIESK